MHPLKGKPMYKPIILLAILSSMISSLVAQSPQVIKETFDSELSKEWFWGLGTWTAKDGILLGYESGPRRHGPVKMRRLAFQNGSLECDFRLSGKAGFAGIIFNGSQQRGHLVHLIMSKDFVRILAHPKGGGHVDLVKKEQKNLLDEWHHVKITFKGEQMTAVVDGKSYTVKHPCIGEKKITFGLGGDSGGPEGKKAGTLQFRKLAIKTSGDSE